MPKINCGGFSLAEILITIAVLAVISLVAIPNIRGFNEGQLFTNTGGKLAQDLRQAQFSAQSNIVCPSGQASVSWSLTFSNTSYTTRCQNNSGGNEVKSTINLSSPITLADSCTFLGQTPRTITFTRQPSGSCSLTLTHPQANPTTVQINIDQGGAIYEHF